MLSHCLIGNMASSIKKKSNFLSAQGHQGCFLSHGGGVTQRELSKTSLDFFFKCRVGWLVKLMYS